MFRFLAARTVEGKTSGRKASRSFFEKKEPKKLSSPLTRPAATREPLR
jgi:hypothetical protein